MKDALGHGSNPRGDAGTHSQAIRSLPRGMSVMKLAEGLARTAAGQRKTNIGAVWQKIASGKRRAVAERVAQLNRIDHPNTIVRVR